MGFGSASRQVNLDQALEMSTKAAVTDARKRCLRLFGEALGGGINDHELQTELKEHVKAERYAKQKADAEVAAKLAEEKAQQKKLDHEKNWFQVMPGTEVQKVTIKRAA